MLFRKKIRWGVMGAGDILRRWIKGARQIRDMELVAVASRSRESAEKAAEELGIPAALSYEELLARDDIDVVYVAVPHSLHRPLALQALQAGKHVLLEKPAAVNEAEFRELAACARAQNRFLMEAAWTRFFPVCETLRQVLDSGEIGQVRAVHSAFAYRVGPSAGSGRLFDPQRAGGSLLDVGVYNFHFADLVLQKEPVQITGLAAFDTDELHLQVDEQASCVALYDGGELAVMTSAIRTAMPGSGWIYGTKGYIEVPKFWCPVELRIHAGKKTRTVESPVPQRIKGLEDEGYQFEIAHVNECIRRGLIESPVMTWDKSMSVLRQCDSLRRAWGFSYPCETEQS